MAMLARSPAQVIAGEAVSGSLQERFQDMLNIASVAYNRAQMTGTSMSDVFSAVGTNGVPQFSAYGAKMPAGTRSLVGLAQAAINQVEKYGPVNNATYYATPVAVDNLPSNLSLETATVGHQYFSDPLNRAIITAAGTIVPDPSKLGLQAKQVTTTQDIETSPVDPNFNASGLLAGSPIATLGAPVATPSAENYAGAGFEGFAKVPSTLGNVPAEADAGASLGLDANARISSLIDNASPFDRMGVPVSSFPSMAAAAPISAPMDVNASLGGMQQPNLAASSGVPWSASLFAPNVVPNPALNSFAEVAAAKPISTPVNASVSAQLGLPSPLEASAVATPSQPTLNNFADLAAAGPIQAPETSGINSPEQQAMDARVEAALAASKPITASPTKNSFVDMANAGPMSIGVPADPNASLGVGAELAASAAAAPVNNETASQRMDIGPPGFDPSRFGDVTASNFDPARLGAPSAVDQVMATPQSYLDAPAVATGIQAPSTTALSGQPAYDQAPGYQQLANTAMPGGMVNLAGTTTVNEDGSLKSSLATPDVASTVSAPVSNGVPMANVQEAADYSMLNSGYHLPTANVPAMASDGLIGAPESIQSIANPSAVPGTNIPSVAATVTSDPNVSLETPSVTPSTLGIPSTTTDPNVSLESSTLTSPTRITDISTQAVDDTPEVTSQITSPSLTSSLTSPSNSLTNTQSTPQHTAMDVWSGLATTGIATDGSIVSKMDDGTIGRYNPKFDQTTYTNVDGSYGGMKKGNLLGTADPNASLSSTANSLSSAAPNSSFSNGLSRLSNSIFSGGTVGSLAGAMLGSALAGPIGGLALGMVGQQLGGKYLGDQVPDESPMHSLFGLLTGSPAPGSTSSSTLGGGGGTYGAPGAGFTGVGGGGGVNGTSTGPGGGGGVSHSLF